MNQHHKHKQIYRTQDVMILIPIKAFKKPKPKNRSKLTKETKRITKTNTLKKEKRFDYVDIEHDRNRELKN